MYNLDLGVSLKFLIKLKSNNKKANKFIFLSISLFAIGINYSCQTTQIETANNKLPNIILLMGNDY